MNQQINNKSLISVSNFLHDTGIHELRKEIIAGLRSKQKNIPSKLFYDKTGSELFEKITHLKEYYPSRTEKSILKDAAGQLSEGLQNVDIVELGSGDNSKISILLNAIDEKYRNSIRYVPVDISQTAIEESAQKISKQFPGVQIHGIIADFMSRFELIPNCTNRLICFFGSTIGNFNRKQASEFLLNLSKNMQLEDKFLIGFDMVKDKIILEAAYNDDKNVTAEFNKNILIVVNNILYTDFNTNDFEHSAFYNEEKFRIEMHLKALKDIQINSQYFHEKIVIKQGETIHTENSHKYSISDISNFASVCKLKIENIFTDSKGYFSLVQFIK